MKLIAGSLQIKRNMSDYNMDDVVPVVNNGFVIQDYSGITVLTDEIIGDTMNVDMNVAEDALSNEEDAPITTVTNDFAVNVTLEENTPMIEDNVPITAETNNIIAWNPNSFEVFNEIQLRNGWFEIKAVRVQYVYKDVQKNHLYLFLLDKNRDRAVALVTSDLMKTYEPMNLEGCVFSLQSFQIDGIVDEDFPRYEGYSLHRDEYQLLFYKRTKLTHLESSSIEFELPLYPKVHSLRWLAQIEKKKMLIDVLGKVVKGQFKKFRDPWNSHRPEYLDLVIKDLSGQELKIKFYDFSRIRLIPLVLAVRGRMVIFVTRVKLDPTRTKNVLICTDLSTIEYEPQMPEAEAIKQLLI